MANNFELLLSTFCFLSIAANARRVRSLDFHLIGYDDSNYADHITRDIYDLAAHEKHDYRRLKILASFEIENRPPASPFLQKTEGLTLLLLADRKSMLPIFISPNTWSAQDSDYTKSLTTSLSVVMEAVAPVSPDISDPVTPVSPVTPDSYDNISPTTPTVQDPTPNTPDSPDTTSPTTPISENPSPNIPDSPDATSPTTPVFRNPTPNTPDSPDTKSPTTPMFQNPTPNVPDSPDTTSPTTPISQNPSPTPTRFPPDIGNQIIPTSPQPQIPSVIVNNTTTTSSSSQEQKTKNIKIILSITIPTIITFKIVLLVWIITRRKKKRSARNARNVG